MSDNKPKGVGISLRGFGDALIKLVKPKNAREAAIRKSGQKGRFSKFIGKQMTGKASPHTSRDESPTGRAIAKAQKTLKKYKDIFKKSGKKKK